ESPDHMLGMQVVGRVNADDVDGRVAQELVVGGGKSPQAELGATQPAKFGVQITEAYDLPKGAVEGRRDDAAPFAQPKNAQPVALYRSVPVTFSPGRGRNFLRCRLRGHR